MRLFAFALIGVWVLGLTCCGQLDAAPAPLVTAAAPASGMSVDAALDALDQRGKDLNSFVADVSLTEQDLGAQLESTRTGKVWYQKLPNGESRLRVMFDSKQSGDKLFKEKIEYLLGDGWLTDRDYQKKIEVRRQVLRPGEKTNLIKLGEGPFPLPIGQSKEEVKKLFTVTLEKSTKDDPVNTLHLILKPIQGTQFARKFSSIEVWMDLKTHFPVRIDTTDTKEQNSRSTLLSNVQLNPPLADKDFSLEKISPADWNIHEEPFSE